MKKLIFFLITILLILSASGCVQEEKSSNQEVHTIDLSGLPIVEIECTKDENFSPQVPVENLKTETKGEIVDYTIHDECAYYIVAYDYYYYDYYGQIAVYKQDLYSGEIQLAAKKSYDAGIVVWDMDYDDGLVWKESNQSGKTFECRLNGELFVESEITLPEIDLDNDDALVLSLSDHVISEDTTEWQEQIPDEYLTAKVFFLGESEDYILWEQWKQPDNYYKDHYINIYDKKEQIIKSLLADDYGIIHMPVWGGDTMIFLTIDDIKSYKEPKDFYENVYRVDLKTMDVSKITENYGREDSINTKYYCNLKSSGDYLFFYSKIRDEELQEDEYEYLYYIKVDER